MKLGHQSKARRMLREYLYFCTSKASKVSTSGGGMGCKVPCVCKAMKLSTLGTSKASKVSTLGGGMG